MLKKIYKVINNLHGSIHHQKCHFLRVCMLKWDLWFQFSKYLQEPLSTWRTYNLFRVVNLGGWGRRKLWWGSYQKGARPNPFASDDDDVEDVAFVDPGPQDQTSFIFLRYWCRSRVPVFLCLLCKYVWCGGQAGGLRGVGRYKNIWHGRRTSSHEKKTVGDIGGKIWIHLS